MKGLIEKPEDMERGRVSELKEAELQEIMRILETLEPVELDPGIGDS